MNKIRIYRTVAGDTWDLIAYKVYGKEEYYHKLIRANTNLIDVVIFDGNTPIIVPEILEVKIKDESKLPPWKRSE